MHPKAPVLLSASPGRRQSSSHRLAELQDELVGVSANRLVEHLGRAWVRRIGENRTLGVELEPRGFDLSAHGRGLDAMQGLGYICGSTQSGGMRLSKVMLRRTGGATWIGLIVRGALRLKRK